MSVEYIKRLAGPFIGDGSGQKVFTFGFLIFDEGDVSVSVAEEENALPRSLTLGEDFSVQMNEDQAATPGGTITLLADGLAKGAVLAIGSAVPYTQTLTLTNYTRFPPERITKELDRIVVQIQQLYTEVERSVRTNATDTMTAEELIEALFDAKDSSHISAEEAAQALALCKEIEAKILQYDWDIPRVVKSIEEVEKYPFDGFFAVGGLGDAGRYGTDISNRFVTAYGSTMTIGAWFEKVISRLDALEGKQ